MEEFMNTFADLVAEKVLERLPKPEAARYMSRAEIAANTGLSPGTVSRIIKAMEAAGYRGIWRRGRNLVRVNYTEFQDFMERGKQDDIFR